MSQKQMMTTEEKLDVLMKAHEHREAGNVAEANRITLEVAGDTITTGAMGCQREIAENIREKGADYVLSLKENQPEAYREVKEYFEYFEYIEEEWERHPPQDVWRSGSEKDHGRIERREALTEEELDWMGSKGKREDLKTIIQYRRARTASYLLRKTAVPEKRFGISRKMLRATLSDDFPRDVLFGNVK
jgi:predicted transposase YbfD/YdcC